jgi:hypothetical protein
MPFHVRDRLISDDANAGGGQTIKRHCESMHYTVSSNFQLYRVSQAIDKYALYCDYCIQQLFYIGQNYWMCIDTSI